LSRVLAAVDVVAVPSLWRENLPLVVLEAAQHGVPALVAPRGGLLETPALCGARVVAEQTPSAWAAALRTAADDAAWREWQAAMHYDRHIEEDLALHLQAGRRP
jgi:glycosyltransferase involved in cell wall biosynthesis